VVKLISLQEFESAAKNGDVDILLDARRIEEFEEDHIPGAMQIAWEDWNEPAPDAASAELHQPGYWGKLADPVETKVAERLTQLGIGNDSRIVVYADAYRSKGREGRIAWMLLYFGAKNVAILNGGLRTWQKSEKVGITPNGATKPFQLELDERRRARKGDVIGAAARALVDTRGLPEFAGVEYDYQPRLGHIPNAIHFPYRRMLHSNGHFVSKEEFAELADKHHFDLNSSPIWYCEVGVRAAMASLLHEIYNGVVTPVYDGSFMEWSFDETLPVSASAERTAAAPA
jgi:thiosulfate/3-mercaptopyruvate sulfurtransferase